ncbi:amidohydrolase [Paeniroseomonas aquatica]|uniref:amidohydrolase n=1 Tax=Paeniroseomonas aquatica TaxID=373043 RepID=UPI003613E2B0
MDLLLTNARLQDGRTGMAIACAAGRIAALLPPGAPLPPAAATHDLGGELVLPGLVDGHMHLDKTTLGLPWMPHQAGPTRLSRIETDARVLPGLPLDTEARATAMIRRVVPFGTAYIRSHCDVTPAFGLTALEGTLAARQAHRHMVHVETVAFPQAGIIRAPGTLELLDAALRAGADLVGGLDPCEVDRDAKGHLDAVFGLAEKHGKGIDIHLHEAGELGLFSLQEFCARTVAHGLQGRATISHGFCLGGIAESKQQAAAALMAESGVALATHGAGGASLPPLGLLRAAGVRILCGHDNLRDTWGPYGSGDMLERAAIIGWRADWRTDEMLLAMLAMVTVEGARAVGAGETGIGAGMPANFFSVQAENGQEAIAQHPGRGWWCLGEPYLVLTKQVDKSTKS